MSTTQSASGGFTGAPEQAFTPPSAGGCCGSAPAGTATATAAATAGPCCGTAAEAAESGSCCGAEAKTEAVAAGQGCCG